MGEKPITGMPTLKKNVENETGEDSEEIIIRKIALNRILLGALCNFSGTKQNLLAYFYIATFISHIYIAYLSAIPAVCSTWENDSFESNPPKN